ncbi:uncharacterized protein LOC110849053 isoform X2 [Folsomia candida]|uniref:uncharacterized protein LOC110849053 isoform X2 n=1 Tax=Folsomia candida TaxID=158441 RepID=UPI0016050870|nr:uncharacterized protein LOC110849053 isoform X2 [Folsomia candida]
MKNTQSKINLDYPGLAIPNHSSKKKTSLLLRQPITTTTGVIPSFPAGYPDKFFPEPVSFSHRHPTKRMLFEAQMMELATTGFLQVDDVTVFSSVRKNASCTITQSDGKVCMLAHKVLATHLQLPLYKGNRTIIQNGFVVKIKNLNGACVLTFKRKSIYKSNETDVLDVWLGNQVVPVGQVRKPALVNEYTVYGELGHPAFVIHKARRMTDPNLKKNYKYIIHTAKDKEIVGQVNCNGRKGFGPIVTSGEYPCHVEFRSEMTITEKSLLMGALFLIASRSHSGIEREEEKLREKLDIDPDEVLPPQSVVVEKGLCPVGGGATSSNIT